MLSGAPEPLNRRGNGRDGAGDAAGGARIPQPDLPGVPSRSSDWAAESEGIAYVGDAGGSHGYERLSPSTRRGRTENEGHRAVHSSGPMDSSKLAGAHCAGGGATSLVPTGVEGSPARAQERPEAAEGPMAEKEGRLASPPEGG